jgi:signal transduction histidine kinase/DNA-binding response OmpR family regulator/streptogramin lyase
MSFFDRQGNLWLGTNDGVFILTIKEQRFKQYLKDKGKDGSIYDGRGIWADEATMYAVSSSNSYRYQFKEATQSPILTELDNNKKAPISIIRSKDNSFWIGTKGTQLCNFDISTGNIQKTINGFTNQLWALYEDKNNRVWIGQGSNGLYYYDPDKMEEAQKYNQLNGFDKIEEGKIVHIVEDRRNNNLLWLSCQSGWYLLDINKGLQKRYWSRTTDNSKILGDEIHYTYQDDNGIFWLATAYSGLVKVQLSSSHEVIATEQFTIMEGLSSNTVYAIYEDDNGLLWMSTNNGINRFDKKTEEIQVFLEEDGLPHYEFNRLSNFQRADGTIFFGTLNGIVSFHPKDLSDIKAYDVPVKISRCEKFSSDKEQMVNITTDVLTKNKIVIAPNQRLTNLYVSVQNYADALKTKYVYRIKGVQNEFIAANKNEISLSGLPYGKHILEVKAKAPDGRFSESIISIPLVILRPFYLRWWFILLSLVSVALSIWQIFQIRTKALKNRKKELEEVVKNRTAQLQEQASQLQLDKNTIEAQAKELRSLDEMKSRFFANISHELRTPLTLILSPVQSIIKRQKTDNRDFTSAQIIEQNANKLLKRINEILDLTKLEAKEMQLQPQPTPFYEFIKRLVATFESLAAQKKQQLIFDYQLDKHLNILLDQDKYEHIFNNYLSNAIKYTPKEGKIDIQLSEKRVEFNGKIQNRIVLTVSDNGQGIPEVDIPKVFDRFFQSKNNQNKTGSSGIGLALSKEIALLMNGEVRVESEVGEGSQFHFEMPFVEAVASSQLPVLSSESSFQNVLRFKKAQPSTDKSTILLVEDNPQLRNYIQLILQEKYNVITAENGRDALEQLATRNPQLVISDIMMPIMDGFELLEQLKTNDQFRHLPVIMLTARSNANDKLKALRIGVDDYILKPFNEDELTARIDNLIQNAASRTAVNENKKATPPTVSAADLKWLEGVEKHLKAEISNSKFNIDSLALVMQMSRSHLHRRIKLITGLPPNKYFREIKLQAAREILEKGEARTVSEICYAVGFDTPKYFSKVFAQRFGKRPIEYLKS